MTIDKIEYGGAVYEFEDSTARKEISNVTSTLNSRIEDVNTNVNRETSRAETVEADIYDKLSKIATESTIAEITEKLEEVVDMVENPSILVGATSTDDGKAGIVPMPKSEDLGKFLAADGKWETVPETYIPEATPETAGLMPASDKSKLNSLVDDDMQTFRVTFGSDALGNTVITKESQFGKRIVNTFLDGKIIQNVRADGASKEYEITFENGVIEKKEKTS